MDEFVIKDQDREVQYKNMMESLGSHYVAPPVQSDSLKASRMRSLVNSYYFTGAYKNGSKVAFVGEQFPNEFLYALKIIPLNLETMAALLSQSDTIEKYLKLTDEYNFSRDICSNVRSSLGIALANCYPSPDIILGNSYPCDGISKLAHIMSKFYNCNFLVLDTPNFISDDSISYLASQLRRVTHEIEVELNIEFREEELIKVIHYSNEAREYFYKTAQLCRTARLPYVSKELLEIVISNPWGLKELVSVCKMLYEEALERSQKIENKKKGKRILWVGQLPFYSNEIIEYLETELELLYLSALDVDLESMLDPKEPFRSIAKRSMLYMWDPIRIGNNISNICNKYEIDGIILLNVWGCRNMLGINHMLRDLTTKNNLKFLTIDADYLDKEKYSFSHIKNRIAAFLEMIKL